MTILRKAPSGPVAALVSGPASSVSPQSGSATTIDWSEGPVQRLTLTANCTIHQDGLPAGESVPVTYLEITQGGVGSFVVSFAGAKTPGGGAGIVLSNGVGTKSIVGFIWDGFVSNVFLVGTDFA